MGPFTISLQQIYLPLSAPDKKIKSVYIWWSSGKKTT